MRLRTSTRSSRSRRFGAECLEARDMLASDVAVSKSGTTLNITGNNSANDVVIVGSETAGTYTVYGIDLDASGENTTINRQDRSFDSDLGGRVFTGIRSININMNGGNDNVILTNVAASTGANRLQNVTINAGTGNDNIVVGGSLTIDTDFTGDATVGTSIEEASGTVDLKGVLTILAGTGNDSITLRGVTSDSLINALGGTGAETVAMTDIIAKVITSNMESGAATFTGSNLTTTTGNLAIINASGRNDEVTVSLDTFDVAGTAVVNTGVGTANVAISNGIVDGSMTVSSPGIAGNDAIVSITAVDVARVLTVVTGAADDTIDILNSTADVMTVNSGNGNDSISISLDDSAEFDEIARSLTVNSGEGDDDVTITSGVTLEGGTAFDFLSVDLGGGDDNLEISNVAVAMNAFFSGGAGFDNFDDNGGGTNDFQGTYTRILFESFDDLTEEEPEPL